MISGVMLHCTCKRRAATLTRLLSQPTSPVKGEVKRRRPAHHLSPGGRGRAHSARVRGETLRSPKAGMEIHRQKDRAA